MRAPIVERTATYTRIYLRRPYYRDGGVMFWIDPLSSAGQSSASNSVNVGSTPRADEAGLIAEMLAALQLIESVYRQNVVAVGEPSSVLDELQRVIAKAALMLQWNTADRRAVAPDGWDRFLMWIAMWACVGLVAAIAALLLP